MVSDIQLYHGDCLEVMKDIPDNSVDLICCDLPYLTTECSWDNVFNYDLCFNLYRKIIKRKGCIAIMLTYPKAIDILFKNKDIFKYDLIWDKPNKTNFANAKNKPMRQHENIFIFSLSDTANCCKSKMNYFPQGLKLKNKPTVNNKTKKSFMGIRDNYNNKTHVQEYTNYPGTIIRTQTKETGLHDTQKPVALLEYLIKTYTNEGDLILDNCCGSGSTGVAAYNTNRNAILIEKDPEIFEIAKKRIDDAQKQPRLPLIEDKPDIEQQKLF